MARKSPTERTERKSATEIANDKAVAGWQERIQAEMDRQRFSMRALSSKAELGATTVRHVLTQANDIGLDTMRRLANALNVPVVYLAVGARGVIEGDAGTNIKLIPVLTHDDVKLGRRPQDNQHGVVAVQSRGYPEDVAAMIVQTHAMKPEGLNHTPPPQCTVLFGDVILWSPSTKPHPGDLVLARGVGRVGLALRRLGPIEDGVAALLSLNHLYPHLKCPVKDVMGTVVAVQRKM